MMAHKHYKTNIADNPALVISVVFLLLKQIFSFNYFTSSILMAISFNT